MRGITTAGGALLALLGLAACADPGGTSPATSSAAAPSAAPPSAPPAGGSAGTRFDGTYTGQVGLPSQMGGSSGSTCPTLVAPQTLRVVNGQLRGGILWRIFNGPVNADGSFSLTGADSRFNAAPGTVQGRVTPTNLEGTFSYLMGNRVTCTYSLSGMTRS